MPSPMRSRPILELGPTCPIVDARDGVVILIGDVPSEELARRAVELATTAPLVASVTQPPAGRSAGARSTKLHERRGRRGHGRRTGRVVSPEAGTKREKRLAAREDRKRRAAAAQKSAAFRRYVLLAVLAIVIIGVVAPGS